MTEANNARIKITILMMISLVLFAICDIFLETPDIDCLNKSRLASITNYLLACAGVYTVYFLFVPAIFLMLLGDDGLPSIKVIFKSYMLVIIVFGIIMSLYGSFIVYSNKSTCILADNRKIRVILTTWCMNIAMVFYSILEMINY